MGTKLLLDGRLLSGEGDFHDAIDKVARAGGFDGYGRNLDALWDMLTGFLEPPVEVRWINAGASKAAFGSRFEPIVTIFAEAANARGADFRFEIAA